jgi:hypothetical protein
LAHVPICEFLLIHDLPSGENRWSNHTIFFIRDGGVLCRVSLKRKIVV